MQSVSFNKSDSEYFFGNRNELVDGQHCRLPAISYTLNKAINQTIENIHGGHETSHFCFGQWRYRYAKLKHADAFVFFNRLSLRVAGQQLQVKPQHFSIHQHRLHFACLKSQTVRIEFLIVINPSCSSN